MSPPAMPSVPAVSASELAAYVSASGTGLAPRGWHCIGGYGSGGAVLLVTPASDTADALPGFSSLKGPAIERLFLNGENSGRAQVAQIVSQLFPSRRRSIDDDEADHTPHGPYPTDRTARRDRKEVDYTTPPHHDGMGTFSSRLAPAAGPIAGAAFLAESNGVDSVVLLNVRLPPHLRALTSAILDAERQAQASRSR